MSINTGQLAVIMVYVFGALFHCDLVNFELLHENGVSVHCAILYSCCLRQNLSVETVFTESVLNRKSSLLL